MHLLSPFGEKWPFFFLIVPENTANMLKITVFNVERNSNEMGLFLASMFVNNKTTLLS